MASKNKLTSGQRGELDELDATIRASRGLDPFSAPIGVGDFSSLRYVDRLQERRDKLVGISRRKVGKTLSADVSKEG